MSPNSKLDAGGATMKASGQISLWSADHSPKQLKMNVCYGGRVVPALWVGGLVGRVCRIENRGAARPIGSSGLRGQRRREGLGDAPGGAIWPEIGGGTHAAVRDLLAEFRDGCAAPIRSRC